MLQRSHDTAIDIDLELARSTSQENPVYYVQYAHARIASILRKAAAEGVGGLGAGDRRRGDGRRRRWRRRRSRPSGRWSGGCSSCPARSRGRGRAPRPAPALRLRDGDRGRLPRLLSRLPGGRRRRSRAPRPRGWRSASRPSGRSPPRSALLGVSAPGADVAAGSGAGASAVSTPARSTCRRECLEGRGRDPELERARAAGARGAARRAPQPPRPDAAAGDAGPGLLLANTTQVYPDDRGTNYAVREGEEVVGALLAQVPQRPRIVIVVSRC